MGVEGGAKPLSQNINGIPNVCISTVVIAKGFFYFSHLSTSSIQDQDQGTGYIMTVNNKKKNAHKPNKKKGVQSVTAAVCRSNN